MLRPGVQVLRLPIGEQMRCNSQRTIDVGGEKAHVVERRRERNHPRGRNPTVAGFEAHHSTKGRRSIDGSHRLSTESERRQARRDSSRRSAARSSGGVAQIVGIAGGSGGEVSKLGGHRFAQNQRARIHHVRHARSLLPGQTVGGKPASGMRFEPVRTEDVFDSHRESEQRRTIRSIWIARFKRLVVRP